jgi:hypothetical protein
MSIKKLFSKEKFPKALKSDSLSNISSSVESREYMEEYLTKKNEYIPSIDYKRPSKFARYGSAEKYYLDSISKIHKTYPYDGSLREKLKWENDSLYIDKFVFETFYPRTNGYVSIGKQARPSEITDNYWGVSGDADGHGDSYIHFKGGPHSTTKRATQSGSTNYKLGFITGTLANKYNESKGLENNLKVSGGLGATVEFWLKKNGVNAAKDSPKQVVFDLWNSGSWGATSGVSASYGRFSVQIRPNVAGSKDKFYIHLQSGSSGIISGFAGGQPKQDPYVALGSGLDITGSEWHHYAITVANSGSKMQARLFVDGEFSAEIHTGSIVGDFNGAHGQIGALATKVAASVGARGWGRLSASLDEFRYWKVARSAEEIGRYWKSQVGGGTNIDDANTKLGVYFKFNEGITTYNSTDAVVLDYSGRMTNGTWTGYDANHNRRFTGSAINEATASATKEFKDPIVYPYHPDVISISNSLKVTGSNHDAQNVSMLWNSIPEWIREDEENSESTTLKSLLQIMSSYFDTLHLQIESLPKFKNIDYVSGSNTAAPFQEYKLESMGFETSEIFVDANIMEQFVARGDKKLFEKDLYKIKNLIYENIYNNLVEIYKSKGTLKSLRNFIRCFGVDDELIKLNIFADNFTYNLDDRYRETASRRKFINFNSASYYDSVVYQQSSSANPNSARYFSGSGRPGDGRAVCQGPETSGSARTVECEVLFPKKFSQESKFYQPYPYHTSSLFGVHSVPTSSNNVVYESLAHPSRNNANYQVYAVRDRVDSNDAYFAIATRVGGASTATILATSSVFPDVYDNSKWLLSTRVRPKKWPIANTGSAAWTKTPTSDNRRPQTDETYVIELHGLRTVLDEVENEFTLSGSLQHTNGVNLLGNPQRFYVGSHRTNFTGTVLEYTDVKIGSFKVWNDYLENQELKAHALDSDNISRLKPIQNTFLFQHVKGPQEVDHEIGSNYYLPKNKTLALWWRFDNITGSDGTGKFVVDDHSSGSISTQRRIWKPATATLVFADTDGGSIAYNQTITIVSTDGTSKTYTAKASNDYSSNEFDADGGFDDKATALKGAIEHSSGHAGKILVNQASNILTLTQSVAGVGGNTTITENITDFAATSFSGGEDLPTTAYGWAMQNIGLQNTALGHFPANKTSFASAEYTNDAKQQMPESLSSLDMVTTLDNDDVAFTREHRPIKYMLSIEKNMYQTISEEMLNFFAGIKDYGDLIGRPVEKYRQDYKSLGKLRELFYERLGNTPNFEKFVDYYKWIDISLSQMIMALLPASAISNENVRTVIESHILERNKYWHKFPTIEEKNGILGPEKEFEVSLKPAPPGTNPATDWWDLATGKKSTVSKPNVPEPVDLTPLPPLYWALPWSKSSAIPTTPKDDGKKAFSFWSTAGDPTVNIEISSGDSNVDSARKSINRIIKSGSRREVGAGVRPSVSVSGGPKSSTISAGNNNSRDTGGSPHRAKPVLEFGRDMSIEIDSARRDEYVETAADEATPGDHPSRASTRKEQNEERIVGAVSSDSDIARKDPGRDEENYVSGSNDSYSPLTFHSGSTKSGGQTTASDIIAEESDGTHAVNIGGWVSGSGYDVEISGSSFPMPQIDACNPEYETPLQGPFTENYVGGWAYRHPHASSGAPFNAPKPRAWSTATAIIVFADTDGGSIDYDQTITIISTDGTSRTYTTKASNNYASNQFDADGGFDDKATALKGAIEHAAGHAGKILVSQASNVLTLTQVIPGAAGNTTVTENITDCAATSFTGGAGVFDTPSTRPEFYHIKLEDSKIKIVSVDSISPHLPRATMIRSPGVKRPVNLQNIQLVTASAFSGTVIGNYENVHEIVQVAGRSINNRHLVKNTASILPSVVSSLSETTNLFPDLLGRTPYSTVLPMANLVFSVPQRTVGKHIITSRFSSPGDSDVSGPDALDLQSGEFSPNNALPYRNRRLLTRNNNGEYYLSRTQAQAVITFANTDGGSIAYNQTITIISADGTSKTYTAKASNDYANNEFDADGGYDDKATALKGAIEHASGHAGKILVSQGGSGNNILTLTQVVHGPSGNTAITENITDCVATNFMMGNDMFAPHPRNEIHTIDGITSVNRRDGLYQLLTNHCGKFGTYISTRDAESNVNTSGSNIIETSSVTRAHFHKIHRNVLRRMETGSSGLVTASVFDNAFITHPIPRSDRQYSWITKSLNSHEYGKSAPLGYFDRTGLISSSAGEVSDVTFLSASKRPFKVARTNPVGMLMPNFMRDPIIPDLNLISPTRPEDDTSVGANYSPGGVLKSDPVIKVEFGSTGVGNGKTLFIRDERGRTLTIKSDTGNAHHDGRLHSDGNSVNFGTQNAGSSGEVARRFKEVMNAVFSYANGIDYMGFLCVHASGSSTVTLRQRHIRQWGKNNSFRIETNKGLDAAATLGYGGDSFIFNWTNFSHKGFLQDDGLTYVTTGTPGPDIKGINPSGTFLNNLLIHRNGPYGYPSWKQIRTNENPLVRNMVINNRISIFKNFNDSNTLTEYKWNSGPKEINPGHDTVSIPTKLTTSFKEPALQVKYHPMIHEMATDDDDIIEIKHTYGNNIAGFANLGLNDIVNYEEGQEKQTYDYLTDVVTNNDNASESTENMDFVSINYKETIWPKGSNTFLSRSFGRLKNKEIQGYSSRGYDRRVSDIRTFWKDDYGDASLKRGGQGSLYPTAPGTRRRSVRQPETNIRGGVNTVALDLFGHPINRNLYLNGLTNPSTSSVWCLDDFISSSLGGAPDAHHRSSSVGTLAFSPDGGHLLFAADSVYAAATSSITVHRDPLGRGYGNLISSPPRWTTNRIATAKLSSSTPKNPWYNDYEAYSDDIRRFGKSFSIAPEFRISEHMDYYIINSKNHFTAKNKKFLTLQGASLSQSAPTEISDFDDKFWTDYVHGDFMEQFDMVLEDYNDVGEPTSISMKCTGIKKLLPYNGFYPATRTVQLGTLLSESFKRQIIGYSASLAGTPQVVVPGSYVSGEGGTTVKRGTGATDSGIKINRVCLHHFVKPLMQPGLLFNSLKSGIAVDYPMYTGSVFLTGTNAGYMRVDSVLDTGSNFRLPFEALVNMDFYPKSGSVDAGRVNWVESMYGSVWANRVLKYSVKRDATREKDSRYELAMHNFLAETGRLFLKGGRLKYFESKREFEISNIEHGKTYFMDVILEKTPGFVMAEGGQVTWKSYASSSLHQASGSLYGPPSRWTSSTGFSGISEFGISDPAYAPYTPPYFYGRATARLAFDLKSIGKPNANDLTIQDIISGAMNHEKTTYFRNFNQRHTTSPVRTDSIAYLNAMQITSSINLFATRPGKKVIYDADGNISGVEEDLDKKTTQWVISPKMEFPVMNFNETHDDLGISGFDGFNKDTGKSIWAGYGKTPSYSDEGIFFAIEESFGQDAGPKTGSLAEVLGFQASQPGKNRLPIGELPLDDEKELSEAIVAIPYLLEEDPKGFKTTNIIADKHFFKLSSKQELKNQINNIDKTGMAIPEKGIETTSISHMVEMMKKYILPPKLDFIHNEDVVDHPFIMYIFEFTHKLKRQELADIWQNIMPEIAITAEIEDVEIKHSFGEHDFFHNSPIFMEGANKPTIHWMVFKVKKRAETSYYSLTEDATDDKRFKSLFNDGESTTYSYNWPYDFCSLVELAKIDASVEISNKNSTVVDKPLPSSGSAQDDATATPKPKVPTAGSK